MKKDPFNGKIRPQYIGNAMFAIGLATFLWFALGIGFLLMVVLTHNQPLGVLIGFPIASAFSFAFALLYLIYGPRIIRSYPKHKIIAHLMFKEYLFEDGTVREDDIFALMIGKREFSKDITVNNVLVETAIYVPSKRIRQFIYEHRDQYNVLHIATIAAEYMKTRKIEAFKALIDMSNSQFEKELLQMAVMDFEKKKRISNKTLQFYLDNDPRKNQKPNVPFCEVLPLPIFLKKGDIVRYKDGRKTRHAIIGEIPDEKKYIDFSDQVYLAYALDKTLDGDNFLFDAHLHLHICDINKTVSSKLTQQELDNLEKIKKAL